MTYSYVKYPDNTNSCIKKVIDDKTTIFLPLEDNGTEEYENLKKWLDEGNTIS